MTLYQQPGPDRHLLHALMLAALLQSHATPPIPRIAGPQPTGLWRTAGMADTSLHHAVVYNWQEPALIGAAALGGLSDLFVYAFCTGADVGTTNACEIPGEAGFLFGGLIGGSAAALFGSTSHPAAPPPGHEVHGNRGTFGALMLGLPSAVVNGMGLSFYCSRQRQGCNASTVLGSIVVTAINAGIGELIGRSIPRFRPIAALDDSMARRRRGVDP